MAVSIGLCLTACDDYDDADLWNSVNGLEDRIAALEAWQAQVNNNIAALQELLNTTDYITSVTEITSDGKVVGYTIEFLKSEAITIYNGTQGDAGVDGETPQIGLTQGTDGNWYWTLNGELMTDTDGNPIRANGEDGKDGQDGADGADGEDGKDGQDGATGSTGATGAAGKDAPTPQIKLGSSITSGTIYGLDGTEQTDADDEAWYLSVDNGKTWYRVTGATGATGPEGPAGADGEDGQDGADGQDGKDGTNGDSWFSSVELSTDGTHYIFTLTSGGTIEVPAYQAVTLTLKNGEEELELGGTIDMTSDKLTLTYSLGGDAATLFVTTDNAGWTATAADGNLTITRGEDALLSCTLLLVVTNNQGASVSYTLTINISYTVEGNTYTVYNAAGLQAWAAAARSDLSISCTLAADIDMTGQEWTPVGGNTSYYTGTFDGAGHTISNLTISMSTNSCVALIGSLTGTVKNLHIRDGNYSYFAAYAGGIVGFLAGSGTISGCSFSGEITQGMDVGGIVGYQSNGTVTACYSSGSVSGNSNVGGIVGWVNNAPLTACYSTATASGGNCGIFAGAINLGRLSACYWSGTGSGVGRGSGSDTQVTGAITWGTAMNAMNSALSDTGYSYVVNDSYNEEEEGSFPLLITVQ